MFCILCLQKPIRNFLDAAAKGAMDSLESVMTSCVWGREAPLGTGTKIELRWQPLHEDLEASQIAVYMFNSAFMVINLYLLFSRAGFRVYDHVGREFLIMF